MIDKIIIKILGHDFINRALIGEALIEARKSEAIRINKIRDDKEELKINSLNLEHEIEIESLKAEIKMIGQTLTDNSKKHAEVEAGYYRNKKDAKKNAVIVAEMEHKGQELLKSLGGFVCGIKGVGTKARQHVKMIEDKK